MQSGAEVRPAGAAVQLFLKMLWISSFTFGGGFVIVSLMKKKFVDETGWLTEEEMLDYTALSQSSPGAIAVNAAILVGWRVAGAPGMLAAVLGTILPPMVVLTVISLCYNAFASSAPVAITLMGMQAGVAAVIMDVVCSMGGKVVKEKKAFPIAMMVLAFIAAYVLKISVILIILAAAALGVASLLIGRKKKP